MKKTVGLRYTGCGLRNVRLLNGFTVKQTSYGQAIAIHDLEGLHRAIGLFLCKEKPRLTGLEIKFLRKELDMSQSQLAFIIGVGETSVRNWESSRGRITKPAERVLRRLYIEHTTGDGTIREMVEQLAKLGRSKTLSLTLKETGRGWQKAA